MEFVEWRDEYNLGDPLIDTHHRVFFEMIRELLDTETTAEDKPDIHEVMLFLLEYIDMNFMAEEELMASIHYPDREAHINLHRQFTQRIDELQRQLVQDPSSLSREALLTVAQSWFLEHILGEDKKLKRWIY